ncbi:MAG: hypothetical protein IKG18_14265 [Atopobiaceae bacterium]|nr:hypothetical protein [Atopobiaceae bacterium]
MDWEDPAEREKKKYAYIPDEPARYKKRSKKKPVVRSDHKHLYRWVFVAEISSPSNNENHFFQYKRYECSVCRKVLKQGYFWHQGPREIKAFLASSPEVVIRNGLVIRDGFRAYRFSTADTTDVEVWSSMQKKYRWVLRKLEQEGLRYGGMEGR